jgi:hypothetical protein
MQMRRARLPILLFSEQQAPQLNTLDPTHHEGGHMPNEKKADKPKRKVLTAAERIAKLEAQIAETKRKERERAEQKIAAAREHQAKAVERVRRAEAVLAAANNEVTRLEALLTEDSDA